MLNALAEDDRPADAEWLMSYAGPDMAAVIEAGAITNYKHFFAAGELIVETTITSCLKALRLRAGISFPFTSHTARHTFATLITLATIGMRADAKLTHWMDTPVPVGIFCVILIHTMTLRRGIQRASIIGCRSIITTVPTTRWRTYCIVVFGCASSINLVSCRRQNHSNG